MTTLHPIDAPADTFDPFSGPTITASVPATGPQREIWAATRMGVEASLAFNESVSIHLRGNLDLPALRLAVRDLVGRHESLRGTFSGDGLTFVIGEPPDIVPVVVEDWSELTPSASATSLRRLLERAVTEPFDLAQGPLVRFTVVRLGREEHVLVITSHHIVCDGWSFGVLARDLAGVYSAHAQDIAPTLEPSERFEDYASQLLSRDARDATTRAERYWVAQFADGAPVLELPTDRPRPAARTYRSVREDRTLNAGLSQSIRQVGARQGASLFTILCTGFALLLERLSGQGDIILGIAAAGQPGAGMPNLVGHLISILPLRVGIDPVATGRDVLSQVRRSVLDAIEHQQLTLGTLLAQLPVSRDPSRPPLVAAVFNLDRGIASSAMPFAGLQAALTSNARRFENFEIFLNAVDRGDTIELECQYNADLFDSSTVQRWLESYEVLLAALSEDPARQVARLPVLTKSDLEVLSDANATDGSSSDEILVHEMIALQAARTPDAIAVECEGANITYAQLTRRAHQVAHALRARGVRRGVPVGLCFERSIDVFVGILGVLESGGAYVPLDPGYPIDRLSYMAADSQIAALLTHERVRVQAPISAPTVISLDRDAVELATYATEELARDGDAATPETPAYIIYTSGSTGKPKGVVLPHRAVANFMRAARVTFEMSADSVVLGITTISFDMAVTELLPPLAAGACIVFTSREVAADGVLLRRLIERSGVTLVQATPATYRLLLAAGWSGGPHLRLIVGGEAVPRDLAVELCARAMKVWNAYGPTETTVWSTVWPITAPIDRMRIGRPLLNTYIYVLDAARQRVPIGVAGELYIAGRGVGLGYLGRPELTAERFVPDEFRPERAARMYRTGDIVRLLPDGTLEYLGRNDTQVKIRGFRIELGEIEAILSRHPAVLQTAVIVREDRPGDKRLVAYIVERLGISVTDGELRAHIRTSLPDYMVPPAYVRLPALPLSATGKIDRRALPAPSANAQPARDDFVEPRTPTEHLIAQLWSEALGVQRVSVEDDFFLLGGHSLLASQVLSRLRGDRGIELPFRAVFEAPTIARFAALVDAQHVKRSTLPGRIPRRATATHAPLSVVQERLWRLEELDSTHAPTHNYPTSFRLTGALDIATLQDALDAFTARHDAMRTSIQVVDGVPTQVIAPAVAWPLTPVDLSALSGRAQDDALAAFLLASQESAMDLARAPLARAWIVRLGEHDHLLLIVQHGVIWDGWSFDIFIREVAEFYSARIEGRAPVLPSLTIRYSDFATFQRQWLASPEMQEQVAWWREELAGDLPVLELPTDHPRPDISVHRGATVSIAFTPEETQAFHACAAGHDATVFMMLFAAYAVLLHRYTGECDLPIGCPVRARTWVETEDVVGPFVNTVTLRTQIRPEMSVGELLRYVRTLSTNAFSRQEMPIELLGARPPVLRALFSMQDARTRPVRMGGLAVKGVAVPQPFAANDLMLWMMETPARGLIAVLNYSSELFERKTADRFLSQLRTLLLAAAQNPMESIAQIEILPPAERERLLTINPPSQTDDTIVTRFVGACAQRPDGSIASGDDRTLTYAECAAHAMQLARALRAQSVPRGQPILIATDDPITRVVGIMGALLSGGSVALASPVDPHAHLARCLQSSGASIVVTDAWHVDNMGEIARGRVVLSMDTLPPADAAFSLERAVAHAQPLDAALVLTLLTDDAHSAVHLSHRDVLQTLEAVRLRLDLDARDVVLVALSGHADAIVLGLLLPLMSGANVVIADDDVIADGDEVVRLARESNVTVLIGSDATWFALHHALGAETLPCRGLFVGAPLTQAELSPLAAHVDQLFTAYGYPETGIWTYLGQASTSRGTHERALGTAIGASHPLVLDDAGHLVPTGVHGHLYASWPVPDDMAGECVDSGRGPGAPWRAAPGIVGGRWLTLFRTGEKARQSADGTFELLHSDPARMVVDGSVIAAPIVERIIARHPAVANVAVRLHQDSSGVARLVAYVVRRRSAEYTDTELRQFVRQALPSWAAPARIVEIGHIPITGDGVPTRAALASPYAPAPQRRRIFEPTSGSQRFLVSLWQELLAVDEVSRDDNFFMLGGFSLLCFRLIDRVHRETGVSLNPRTILLGTLEQVAAQLEASKGAQFFEPLTVGETTAQEAR